MTRFKKYASDHPIGFSLVITVIFLFFTVVSGLFTYPVSSKNGKQIVTGMVRLTGALFFIWLIWRFEWLKKAGITSLGDKRIWLLVLPAIFYTLLVYTYGFFGKFTFTLDDLVQAASVSFNNMTSSAIQEIVYRGVILYALVLSWRNTRIGLAKSALISAIFFGAVHFFNLVNIVVAMFSPIRYETPVIATILQVLNTFIAGFVYAAIVLYGGSIWPVVVYHGLLNTTINVLWLTTPDAVETVNAWVLITLLKIPLIIYGCVLMKNVRRQSFSLTAQVV